MTSTKVKSAASLLMNTVSKAGLGAKSAAEDPAMEFSMVYDQTTREVFNMSGVSDNQFQQSAAPLRVDKSSQAVTGSDSSKDTGNNLKDSTVKANDLKWENSQSVKESATSQDAKTGDSETVRKDTRSEQSVTGESTTVETDSEVPVRDVALEEDNLLSQDVLELISTAIADIKELITDILDISQEQLSEGLEILGLSDTELLDVSNVKPLVVELAGEGDALNIITNENLFEKIEQLKEGVLEGMKDLVEELSKDLTQELTPDQLKEVLEAFENQIVTKESLTDNAPTVLTQESNTLVGETKDFAQTTENVVTQLPVRDEEMVVTQKVNNLESDDPDHIMEDPQQDVSLTDSRTQHSDITTAKALEVDTAPKTVKEDVTENTTVQDITGEASKEALVTPEGKAKNPQQDTTGQQSGDQSGDNKGRLKSQNSSKETGFDPLKDAGASAVRNSGISQGVRDLSELIRPQPSNAPIMQEAPLPTAGVDAYDILRQINQNMNAALARELTEVHIKLNPETLGNLHIHVTAKEGVITAQFIAENEAVKNALQSQTVELKENLESHGLKVEAVEVTIGGQELNRSYQQNGEGQGRFEEPKKNKTGKIQLSLDGSLEDIEGLGELDEDDRLTAEMMYINGNRLDYRA